MIKQLFEYLLGPQFRVKVEDNSRGIFLIKYSNNFGLTYSDLFDYSLYWRYTNNYLEKTNLLASSFKTIDDIKNWENETKIKQNLELKPYKSW